MKPAGRSCAQSSIFRCVFCAAISSSPPPLGTCHVCDCPACLVTRCQRSEDPRPNTHAVWSVSRVRTVVRLSIPRSVMPAHLPRPWLPARQPPRGESTTVWTRVLGAPLPAGSSPRRDRARPGTTFWIFIPARPADALAQTTRRSRGGQTPRESTRCPATPTRSQLSPGPAHRPPPAVTVAPPHRRTAAPPRWRAVAGYRAHARERLSADQAHGTHHHDYRQATRSLRRVGIAPPCTAVLH